ncbi:hypothetical protein LTR51_001475 [Lithohypha guttulata]|nr:hypothetical protein LTR51_001475 [Lithohypha guttulata]
MNSTSKRPNFLIIVADDMGFSDAGCFGSEIWTPNIDKLASTGLRLTGFHAAAACSPTRAMILTGTDHHIAGLGNLIEWTDFSGQNFPKGSKYTTAPQRGMPGYEGYLNSRVAALPEVLRDGGYHTMMSGKWHLGLTKERSPHARGFDRSLALLPACSNHYDYRPDADFPKFLEKSVIALHMEDDHYVDELPEGWYSSDGYGDKMLQYLKEWHDSPDLKQKPFFAYYPFSAPHWPLQAPKQYVDRYRDVYNEGPEALRQARLTKLIELGMIPQDVRPHPVIADEVQGWDEMSESQRKLSSRAMEAYAGMVECLDHNIGRVTSYLESIGELDNTFIMFFSDNGAEGAAYEALHKDKQGTITDTFVTVMDITPTLLSLAGIKHPSPEWKGRSVVPMRGLDMIPYLQGSSDTIHHPSEAFGWELCGRAAIRVGQYKAVFLPFPKGISAWQLYDLSADPGETDDLAQKMPEKLEELLVCWEKYCDETGVVPLQPELGARWHEAVEAQMKEGEWMEYEYWKPGALKEENRQKFVRNIQKLTDPRSTELLS